MSVTKSHYGIPGLVFEALRLALITSVLGFGSAGADDSYWLVQEDGATRITAHPEGISVDAATPMLERVRTASASSPDGSIWLFDGTQLHGFDESGDPLAVIVIDRPGNGSNTGLHVDANADRVWLVENTRVRAYTFAGVEVAEVDFGGTVLASAYDPANGLLYVADNNSLRVLDSAGSLAGTIDLPKAADVQTVSVSPDGSRVLIGGQRSVVVLVPSVAQFQAPHAHSLKGRMVSSTMGDERGWLFGLHEFQELSLAGAPSVVHSAFPSPQHGIGEGIVNGAAAGMASVIAIADHHLVTLDDTGKHYREIADLTGRPGKGIAVFAAASPDVDPPVVEILDPPQGAYRQAFATVQLYAEDERSEVDYAAANVSNSAGCVYEFASAVSTPEAATYVCDAQPPDGELTITASVPDSAGNLSDSVSVDVIVDTVAPVFDISRVSIEQDDEGTVLVSMPAGSAEPGARVILVVEHDGNEQRHELVVGENGGFEIVVAAVPGDVIRIEALDRAGNSTGVSEHEVKAEAYSVRIESPVAASTVEGNRVNVSGRYTGEGNVGITVNGRIATLGVNNTFFVEGLLLAEEGPATLTAVLSLVEGEIKRYEHSVNVVHTNSDALQLETLSATGAAPFETRFSVTLANEQFDSLHLDLDGDGSYETAATPGTPVSYTYTAPGMIEVGARVVSGGVAYTDSTTVFVTSRDMSLAALQAAWDNFNLALLAGDAESAVHYLSVEQREKYRPALNLLVDDYAAIHASMVDVRLADADGVTGEYVVVREINGNRQVFLVQFIRSADGVWRISAL